LRAQFPDIHPLILQDLRTPTIRPLSENYESEIYMVMHFPTLISKNKVHAREIDFILRQKSLVTVQYDSIAELERMWDECGKNGETMEQIGKSPAHLLYYLLKSIFSRALTELDQIQTEIDNAEEKVFSGKEKEIFTDITLLKRDVLDFSRALKPQRMTLEALLEQGPVLYGEQSRPFFSGLLSEYTRVAALAENHKEALDALYDTTSSLLATKTNETMRVFTILAFISFIPTAVANIYGMNVINIPFAQHPLAFWIVFSFMALATFLIYLALKWRKLI
jgi:magnesium transporter